MGKEKIIAPKICKKRIGRKQTPEANCNDKKTQIPCPTKKRKKKETNSSEKKERQKTVRLDKSDKPKDGKKKAAGGEKVAANDNESRRAILPSRKGGRKNRCHR